MLKFIFDIPQSDKIRLGLGRKRVYLKITILFIDIVTIKTTNLALGLTIKDKIIREIEEV
jgi:hypothetical protein